MLFLFPQTHRLWERVEVKRRGDKISRDDDDLPVEVLLVKSAFTKCEVDEAKMPFCAKSGVEVAAVGVP